MPKHIDVDTLKEWVENWFEKNRYYHPYSKSNDIPIPELYDILERMPTADVVERKRGKWIYREAYRGARFGFMECSCCGESVWLRKEGPDKYCRNCGAEMEVENG